MPPHLLGDENREVAIFLVDLGAEGHEAKHIETKNHTPEHQLPVAQVFEERATVLQQLQHAQMVG